MKKTISRMAAAVFAAAMLAACSGSDDVVNNNVTPEQPTAKGEVVLSGTIGCKDMTRSVNTDGSASWAAGEQFAIYYPTTTGHSTAIATINSVNDNGSANFQVTLYYPVTGNVNLIYPASAHDGQGSYKTDELLSQGGTLAYINDNGLDIHTATASLTVENTNGQNVKAELNSDVQLDPQLCIYTFSLKKDANTNLSATKLEITAGNDTYTVTPSSATKTFTVALKPISNGSFTFVATEIVYTKQNVTLATCTADNIGDVFDKDGNIYSASNGPGVIYSATFSGKTLAAGMMYNSNLTLEAGSGLNISPVAMIAYVGEPGTADTSDPTKNYRGLAMAMQDVGNTTLYTWGGDQSNTTCTYRSSTFTDHRDMKDLKGISNTAKLAAGTGTDGCGHSDHNAAIAASNYSVSGFTPSSLGCSGWFLPSSGQWFKFFEACKVSEGTWSSWTSWGYAPNPTTGTQNSAENYARSAGVMKNAGAYGGSYMWSSSEVNANRVVAVNFNASSGVIVSRCDTESPARRVRPFLAF